jgi:glycosyltransferase involved in cell wall biosynthesis
VTADLPGPRLRIAVLGDFESPHTQRYVRFFAERGHEVHAISYYVPANELYRVELHVLSGASGSGFRWSRDKGRSTLARIASRAPPSLMRLVQALRYQRAGLGRVLRQISADVFHAHYVVEHGFYGAFAATRPFVVTAWGSDLLRESYTPLGKLIARWTLGRADLVTGNDPSLLRRAQALGVPAERTALIRVGIDSLFLDARSVNLKAADAAPPTIISDRALEPLYNVETVIRAFGLVHARLPLARLIVAGDGSQRPMLERLARELGLGEAVRFLGQIEPADLQEALASAHVYVSVPSTDSMAVSNLEAMAVGALPVLSDLPSLDGWITHGVNGLLVPSAPSPAQLADALFGALTDASRRKAAIAPNRARVEAEGTNERNMLLLERLYYRLAGHPVSDAGSI